MWVKDGDRSTNVCHNTAKIRNHVNHITSIVDDFSHAHTKRVHIENSFLEYFSKLWDEPNPNSFSYLLHVLPQDLNIISEFDCDILTKEILKDEAFSALNSLEDGKSLGLMVLMLNSSNSFGKTLVPLFF